MRSMPPMQARKTDSLSHLMTSFREIQSPTSSSVVDDHPPSLHCELHTPTEHSVTAAPEHRHADKSMWTALPPLPAAITLSLFAALCSTFGGLLATTLAGAHLPLHRLAYSQAALGAALLFMGCFDVLPEAAAGISATRTALCFAAGATGSALAAYALRRRAARGGDLGVSTAGPRSVLRAEVLLVGMVTFVSLSAHNVLEGMSIVYAVREGLERGVRLAAAVSLENIPEGVCIAMPVYFATRRRDVAVRLALISGMLEVVGVLLGGGVVVDQRVTSSVMAVVAGILVFVAAVEMLPLAVKWGGGGVGLWMGGGVMSATLLQPLLMYNVRVGLVE